MGGNLSNLEIGDDVVIGIVDDDTISQIKMDREEGICGLIECVTGPCKLIQVIGTDGVILGPSGSVYRINSQRLVKYEQQEKIEDGAVVEVIRDDRLFETLQIGHGEMPEGIRDILGQRVTVTREDGNGGYSISYGDKNYLVNAMCVRRDPRVLVGDRLRLISDVEELEILQVNHGGWCDLIRLLAGSEVQVERVLEDGDCRVSWHGMRWVVNPNCFVPQNERLKRSLGALVTGNVVRVADMALQTRRCRDDGHRGWLASLRLFGGQVGVVHSVKEPGDGSVKVVMNKMLVTFNRLLLTKINAGQVELSARPRTVPMPLLSRCLRRRLGRRVRDALDSDLMLMMRSLHKLSISRPRIDSESDVVDLEIDELFSAVNAGDWDRVVSAVQLSGANVTRRGVRPLMVAALRGHVDIARYLVAKGADVMAQDSNGDSALHVAVMAKSAEICKCLLRAGASVSAGNDAMVTPLMAAARFGDLGTLETMLEAAEGRVDAVDSEGETALHHAVRASRVDSVETLLRHGAAPQVMSQRNMSPFHLAAMSGHVRILEIFLRRFGSSIVDLQKDDKFSALHLTALNSHVSSLKLLIDHGADINIRNCHLQTALHLAVSRNRFQCVQVLVENGAELNLKDHNGDTALHLVMMSLELSAASDLIRRSFFSPTGNHDDIMIYLIEKGASLVVRNHQRQTPLELVTDDQRKQRVLAMCPRGALVSSNEGVSIKDDVVIEKSMAQNIEEMRRVVKEMEDKRTCSNCRDKHVTVTFRCGHMSCDTCANNSFECYLCGGPIDKKIKIYE